MLTSLFFSTSFPTKLQFDNIKVALVVEEEHPFHIAFEIDGLDGEGKNWKYRRDNSISRYIEDPSGNKIVE